MRSRCRRSIITMSAPSSALAHVGEHLDPHALDAGRQQRGGPDDAHLARPALQQDDVRARHARMQDVAADRDNQAVDRALVAADRERVEQRLRRVLVRPVAGVDDRAVDLAGQEVRPRRQRGGARRSGPAAWH